MPPDEPVPCFESPPYCSGNFVCFPAVRAYAGLPVFAQGVLLDPTPGSPARFALTGAVELRLGS